MQMAMPRISRLFSAQTIIGQGIGFAISKTAILIKSAQPLLHLGSRKIVEAELIRIGALRQSSFLQSVTLVTITFSDVVIGLHICSFTLREAGNTRASRPQASYRG